MTKHLEVRNKIKGITKRATFELMLEESMLSDKEKTIMKMYYIEKKDFSFIADTLGYSKAGIIKIHKRILSRLAELLL